MNGLGNLQGSNARVPSVVRRRLPSGAIQTRRDSRIETGSASLETEPVAFASLWRIDQSSGSTFTRAASWLLPTQKVTGLVELSMNTVRMLVSFGIMYSTFWRVLGL